MKATLHVPGNRLFFAVFVASVMLSASFPAQTPALAIFDVVDLPNPANC